MRRPRNQGVVDEAGVLVCVLDDEGARLQDGVPAKGYIATGFLGVEPLPGLEPLALLVDQ